MSKKLFTTSIGEFVTSQAEEIKKEDISRDVTEIMNDYKKYDQLDANTEVSVKTLPNNNGFRITYKSPSLKKKLYVPVEFAPQVAKLRTLIGERFKSIFGDFGLQGFTPDSISTIGPSSSATFNPKSKNINPAVIELWDIVQSDLTPGKKLSEKAYKRMVTLTQDLLDSIECDTDDDDQELTEEEMEAMPYTDDEVDMHELIAEAADLAIEEMNKEHTGEQL